MKMSRPPEGKAKLQKEITENITTLGSFLMF